MKKNFKGIKHMINRIYGQMNDLQRGVSCENDLALTHGIQESYTDEYINIEQSYSCQTYMNGRFVVLLDGDIYNVPELKSELAEKGTTFQTDLDTEVLLNLYIMKNKGALSCLRGGFAFIIWDKQKRELFAARDPFGIKPFYYKECEKGLIFASEQKVLLNNQGTEGLSIESLQNYLTFQYVPGKKTLVKNIQQLNPGRYLTKKPGEKVHVHEYFQIDFQINATKTLEASIEQTREALEGSVHKHMQGNQSIGAYLSGGIDSASIVALAKQYCPSLQTFTVGFKREAYSEMELAQETADELGVENIQKTITPEEVIQELPHIIWHMDDPVADPAAIPNYFVAKEASKHVDVVLSGEGADELFGGYNIYQESKSLKVFDYIPNFLKRGLYHLSRLFPESMKGKSFIQRGTTPLRDRYVGNAYIFSESKKRSLLRHYNGVHIFTKVTEDLFQHASHYDEPTQMQYIDLHTWLAGDILTVADRMTSAHSLEMRVPFLDKHVFEVARTLPSHVKLKHGTTKYVLRQAMKDLIPQSVTTRQKLGFPVPIRHWLRNELYEWAKHTIDNSPTDEVFHKQKVQELLEKHVQHKHDYSRELWTILTFMVWYETFLETSPSGSQFHQQEIEKEMMLSH